MNMFLIPSDEYNCNEQEFLAGVDVVELYLDYEDSFSLHTNAGQSYKAAFQL